MCEGVSNVSGRLLKVFEMWLGYLWNIKNILKICLTKLKGAAAFELASAFGLSFC